MISISSMYMVIIKYSTIPLQYGINLPV